MTLYAIPATIVAVILAIAVWLAIAFGVVVGIAFVAVILTGGLGSMLALLLTLCALWGRS